ncbi:MAG: response regulator [Rickettsiales bacterium]|nr:response regulator [Rickettsiales bacterium]
MNNFLKISVVLLLLLIQGVFIFFYLQTHNKVFYEVFTYFFSLCAVTIFLILLPNIYKSFKKFSEKQKNRKHLELISNNDFEAVNKAFLENHPIATIICDDKLNIKYSNRVFQKFVERILQNQIKNIKELLNISISDFELLLKSKNQNNYENFDCKLSDNKEISIYAVPIIGQESNDILIQLIDNSEKIELKEKFIQAQKMQAIGQLAGGIAHDFNNLLTAIIGFCDLLLTRHPPGDQSFVDLMQIKQNANRAANLVKQLLAFSRKQTLQMQVVNLTETLSEVSNLIRRLIGENILLELNNAREIWDIKVDKSQLEQVIINLAVNARDAMPKGGKLIISTENLDIYSISDIKFKYEFVSAMEDILPGKYVKISIEDTGIGISEKNLKKIFEPFFTTKGVGQGTGLGLATVTGIVEQSGGYIFVSSQENLGTEFIILFKKFDKAIEKPSPIIAEVEKQKDLTGTGTILIVEDEDPVRLFSTRALRNKGYKIFEANSGEAALEVIKQNGNEINLIISDVVMPGISGPEMVEQVMKTHPKIKVIFVSGYGEDAFYQKYGSKREFNFLPKPYTLNQLAERVKQIL